MRKLYIITAAAFITITASMHANATCNIMQNTNLSNDPQGLAGLDTALVAINDQSFTNNVLINRLTNAGLEEGRTFRGEETTDGIDCTNLDTDTDEDDADPSSPVQ